MQTKTTASQRWRQMDMEKATLVTRCKEYARWTLPYICPPDSSGTTELQGPKDSIGAQGVNHLANKLIMTLFQPSQPFFRLSVSMKSIAELEAAAKAGDDQAKEDLAIIDQQLAAKEKEAMSELDFNRFRTEAIMAAKHLIITGNTLMYVPDRKSKGKTQVYGIKDYCITRDLSGNVIELITRDQKSLYTFSEEVQKKIQVDTKNATKLDETYKVDLYTWVRLEADGRFKVTQYANETLLDTEGSWTASELPWIPLSWNLVRGEHYGRGLVEDYSGAFHALDILTESYVTLAAIASDIKFLVDPTSTLDPVELNASASGTYHAGRKDDVTTVQLDKLSDVQTVMAAIQGYQQQIGRAFLLNSAVRRDAERVTAEEIRADINELDMAHGGIYSRFSEEWQLHLAVLILKRIGLNLGNNGEITPQIITGLDSLSRAGDLDNLRMFISDLALLEGVPEEMRGAIDPIRFAEYIGIRRGVDYTKFVKSNTQMQAEQQAAMQQQQQMVDGQAAATMAAEAGKQAMRGEQA